MADELDHDSPWKETLDRFLQPFLERKRAVNPMVPNLF